MKNILLRAEGNGPGLYSFNSFGMRENKVELLIKSIELINEKYQGTRKILGRRNNVLPIFISNDLESFLKTKILDCTASVQNSAYEEYKILISKIRNIPYVKKQENIDYFPFDEYTSFWIISFYDEKDDDLLYIGSKNVECTRGVDYVEQTMLNTNERMKNDIASKRHEENTMYSKRNLYVLTATYLSSFLFNDNSILGKCAKHHNFFPTLVFGFGVFYFLWIIHSQQNKH